MAIDRGAGAGDPSHTEARRRQAHANNGAKFGGMRAPAMVTLSMSATAACAVCPRKWSACPTCTRHSIWQISLLQYKMDQGPYNSHTKGSTGRSHLIADSIARSKNACFFSLGFGQIGTCNHSLGHKGLWTLMQGPCYCLQEECSCQGGGTSMQGLHVHVCKQTMPQVGNGM